MSQKEFPLDTVKKQSIQPANFEQLLAALKMRRRTSVSTQSSDKSRRESTIWNQANALPRLSMYQRLSIPRNSFSSNRLPILNRANITSSGRIKIPIEYENTYQLEAPPDERFNAARAKKVASDCLASFLGQEKYEAKKCAGLAKSLAEIIKRQIADDLIVLDHRLPPIFKQENMSRYKIICFVVISNLPEFMFASKCLIDSQTDNYVSAQFRSPQLCAVATVYAMYSA